MVHGPYGDKHSQSIYVDGDKYMKNYPRALMELRISNVNRYPLYRGRKDKFITTVAEVFKVNWINSLIVHI
jgi:hypothetical protein